MSQRETTPAPGPAPAAQQVPTARLFTLRALHWSVRWCRGVALLLDGGVVGNRGAAAGLGQVLCPKRIREWVQTEENIRQANGGGGGKANRVHAERVLVHELGLGVLRRGHARVLHESSSPFRHRPTIFKNLVFGFEPIP